MKSYFKFLFALLFFCANNALSQNINTVAGTGSSGFSGDGSAAISASLNGPQDVALDTFGNIYIADASNRRIRKITASTGIISTIAGTGTMGYSGDGGAATAATFNAPIGLTVSPSGDVFIADVGNHCIRKITAGTGIISTVAGTGTAGFSGDGGAATAAALYAPYDIALDGAGNIFIADVSNNRIRKITVSTGFISTVAGTGTAGFSGDGASATAAKLSQPFSVAIDSAGNLYIADATNSRIRKVTASTGNISTIAGTGVSGFGGDGGAATAAQMTKPYSISLDNSGNIYFSDFNNHRVRKITAATNIITSISGTGTAGFSGDGGVATAAKLNFPKGIFVDRTSNVYIADEQNQRVRFICNAATIPAAPLVISPVALCTGTSPAPLTAIGSSLKWFTTATGGSGSTTAPTPSVSATGSTTYYVSQSSACGESPRAAIVVTVSASPSAPIVTTPITYCNADVAASLTASGSGLKWYTSAIGDTGISTAPTPNTLISGTFIYYVSQSIAACESPKSAINVVINPRPSAPLVSDIRYCLSAAPIPLTASGSGLKWYTVPFGGAGTAIAPTPSATVEGSFDYYVTQSNSFGCESVKAKLNVLINVKPSVKITSLTDPKFFICKGSKLTLKSSVTPYGYDYQWQMGTTNIPGATADTLAASSDGNYRLIVSNAPNCNDTASVFVEQDTSIIKTSISPTDINICDGVEIKIFSSGTTGAGFKYEWYKDGLLLPDTTVDITVGVKGVYEVKIINPSGCFARSNAALVSTYSSVVKPVLAEMGSNISVPNTYAFYQWYRNGKAIPGANKNFYDLTFEGEYSLRVSDINGCANTSDTILIKDLSLNIFATNNQYKIYPNPTQGKLFITAKNNLSIEVLDIMGKQISLQKNTGVINLESQADGIYFLKIRDDEGLLLGIEKIIKSTK